MLVEEILTGMELIIGAKIDFQFGPIVILGIGGTAVEIYQDTSIRMAPLTPKDVLSMIKNLKAHRLIEGYRGSEPVNLNKLTEIVVTFSDLLMELEDVVESIDLNPVMCSSKKCIVADARIMLASNKS
jgi:acyl-CoA synthetase (NDP forming)